MCSVSILIVQMEKQCKSDDLPRIPALVTDGRHSRGAECQTAHSVTSQSVSTFVTSSKGSFSGGIGGVARVGVDFGFLLIRVQHCHDDTMQHFHNLTGI